ncbi:MAG: hypothetical protein CVV64_07680 [Candidatus Wallbacteria bacterium HGW-Wallbacteria-1]|jgi:CRP-like cAMP-binding protein|uniref:Cyclic nucleotide-binding domain-containing protein n=1 Tax=Candidatus Wallbacteria bacterium HGW-Wallbacteria-1 TaxID=2013854 RepID=A0A2N1PQY8_9BACT|nr:MAG: hypothetical protein CVV64_07680 [Candidatus Wallbacteria bacterium HGW-Wallbacteria-1]
MDDNLLRIFQTGEFLCREGEPGESMYVIRSGRVQIQRTAENGKIMDIAVIRAGDFLGEMALIETRPRSASAFAIEPTRAIEIGMENLQAVIRTQPDLTFKLMRMFCSRLREANRMVEEQTMLLEGARFNGARMMLLLAGYHFSFEEIALSQFSVAANFRDLEAVSGIPASDISRLYEDLDLPESPFHSEASLANVDQVLKKGLEKFSDSYTMSVTGQDIFDPKAWQTRIRLEKNPHIKEKLVRKYRYLCDLHKPEEGV